MSWTEGSPFPCSAVGPGIGVAPRTRVAPRFSAELRISAAVPVKTLARAKSRLRGLLPDELRVALILSMLRDVLGACKSAGIFAAVGVVTADDAVGAVARELGVVPVMEPRSDGLNAAVRRAAAWAVREGADALLILSGDLPLAHPYELARLADAASTAEVVIVPEHGGEGTNALLMRPPGRIATRFGPGSRRWHQRAAEAQGANWQELHLVGLGLDVDRPEDVRRIAELLLQPPRHRGRRDVEGDFRTGGWPDFAAGAHTRAFLQTLAGAGEGRMWS